jgi:hypothetical protein
VSSLDVEPARTFAGLWWTEGRSTNFWLSCRSTRDHEPAGWITPSIPSVASWHYPKM